MGPAGLPRRSLASCGACAGGTQAAGCERTPTHPPCLTTSDAGAVSVVQHAPLRADAVRQHQDQAPSVYGAHQGLG
jgi:hypothetical protein